MGLYNRLLQRCELNRHTTEAAAGALQNITAGDRRVSRRTSPTPRHSGSRMRATPWEFMICLGKGISKSET